MRQTRWIPLGICLAVSLEGQLLHGQAPGKPHEPQATPVGPIDVPAPNNVRGVQLQRGEAKVSLDVRSVPLADALQTIAQRTGIKLTYPTSGVLNKRVSVKFDSLPVSRALTETLRGTGLQIDLVTANHIAIAIDSTKPASGQSNGSVIGRVTDSATGKTIGGVNVVIVGTNHRTVTKDNGAFTLADVPAGEQTVQFKMMGYATVTKKAHVAERQAAQVNVVMRQMASMLTGVVTTATGQQRAVEVGNDVVVVNVDSVMKTAPINNVSDLLASRVPGVSVIKTSGAPGAPSRIRIRGLSSLNASNDPIVYLDGIRIQSTQGSNGEGIVTNAVTNTQVGKVDRSRNMASDPYTTNAHVPLAPSPIDQIDPNSIETIEVLKGPSAVAMYGTDAANGVIIIKTKRGRNGPIHWNGSVTTGTQSLPGKWPVNYWMWGTPLYPDGTAGEGAVQCTVQAAALGKCRADSLRAYQAFNDPYTTILGRGGLNRVSGGLNGGVKTIRYSFNGTVDKMVGYVKMPDIDVALLKENGRAVPDWQRRPENYVTRSVSMGIDLEPRDGFQASFTQRLFQSISENTPLAGAGRLASRIPPPGQIMNVGNINNPAENFIVEGSGIIQAVPDYERRTSTRSSTNSNSVILNYAPTPFLSFRGLGGIDVEDRNDKMTLARDACRLCTYPIDTAGRISTMVGGATMTSVDVQMTSRQRWKGLKFETTIGGNFVGKDISDITESAYDIPVGATSSRGAANISSFVSQYENRTAGAYVETRLGIADQFWLPIGFRTDGGSGSGDGNMTSLPRLAFSYLVSNQPFFQYLPVLNRLDYLRLRSSMGVAAQSPSAAAKLRLAEEGTGQNYGINGKTVSLTSAGNPDVRPERTRELEGGFELGIANDRVVLDMTFYRKSTLDMLVKLDLPWSLGSVRNVQSQMNVGTVTNTGLELTLDTRILANRTVEWTAVLDYSQNANLIKRLGRSAVNAPGPKWLGFRYAEGYPVNGYWGRPILSYEDANQNGVIDGNEIALSDSVVYVGSPNPKYRAAVRSTVTLMQNLSMSIGLDYQHKFSQLNETLTNPAYSRANNDPNTPLGTQALYLVAGCQRVFLNSNCNTYALARPISILRFQSVSASFILPRALLRRANIQRQVTLAVQGSNLGFISSYSGKDPNVSSSSDDMTRDDGVLPTPRAWQFVIRF